MYIVNIVYIQMHTPHTHANTPNTRGSYNNNNNGNKRYQYLFGI